MSESSYILDSLGRRVIFLTGKGGVGKTSVCRALALNLARRGRRTAIASFSYVRGPRFENEIRLDTMGCFKEYALKALKFERVFNAIFENSVLKAFVLAAPGLGETVMAGKIWDVIDENSWDTVVVDLPASGHAVSFFRSLVGVIELFKRGYVHRQTERILGLFTSDNSRVDIVMTPSEFAVTEGIELHANLNSSCRLNLGFTVFNQLLPDLRLAEYADKKDLKRFINDYETRKRIEAECIRLGEAIPLPSIRLPWFTSKDILFQLSSALDVA